jgi:hypothetical protein
VEPPALTRPLSTASAEWAVRLMFRQGLLRREVASPAARSGDEVAALDACLRQALCLPRPRSLAALAALARATLQRT